MTSLQDPTPVSTPCRATPRRATALLLLCCAVAGAHSAAAAALTSDSLELPHIAVKFDPKTLASDRGAADLYRRLVAAAKAVCPSPADSALFLPSAIRQCREESLARAVAAIDSPRLSAVYRAAAPRG